MSRLNRYRGALGVSLLAVGMVAAEAPAPLTHDRTIAQRNNAFAVNLYRQLIQSEPASDNLVYSPFSLFTAGAFASAGAKGSTHAEWVRVFELPLDPEELHGPLAELTRELTHARPLGSSASPPEGAKLGVQVAEVDGPGVVITTVFPDSPAAKADLQVGDVIIAMNGAAIETLDDIARTFKEAQPPLKVTVQRSIIVAIGEHRGAEQGSPAQLVSANALWVAPTETIRPEFAELAQTIYGAEAQSRPLDRPETTDEINGWVRERTGGLIDTLHLPPAGEEPLGVVLVNATAFRGNWEVPFPPKLMGKEQFFPGAGEPIQTMFLRHPELPVRRADLSETLQAIEIPYAGGSCAMVILMPEQWEGFEQSLTSELLDGWLDQLHAQELDEFSVSIPKFEVASRPDVDGALRRMGLQVAWQQGQADFSGITGKANLALSGVAHAATIVVDEVGTRASAGSELRFTLGDSFAANRPFVFLIRDAERDVILFMGRFVAPDVVAE